MPRVADGIALLNRRLAHVDVATLRSGAFKNGWILAGLFGALAYVVVAGLGPLDVTNTTWIFARADIVGSYYGWRFYREAPWSAAIAHNPTYGMDFSGSILFADAIPVMAMLFKALSPLLPDTFQYFGIWTFMSFVLQGIFGWLLMARATSVSAARVLGAFLISLTPLYCYRLVHESCTHMSLTAHWPVLAALCLCLSPQTRRPWLWWALLILAMAFTHAYVFCMVATLWLADLCRRFFYGASGNWRRVLTEAGLISVGVGGLVWVTGVWAGPPGRAGGFGLFKMNVLALLDPLADGQARWSYILPNLPSLPGDYEGFAFLGLGGVILTGLALWALPQVLREAPIDHVRTYWPLAGALIGMGIFALSRNVSFGEIAFWAPWPRLLHHLGELFRATGRFIWPFYYFLFFAGMLIVSRRYSQRTLLVLLSGIVTVQAIDTTAGWRGENAYLHQPRTPLEPRFRSRFWDEAAMRYRAIRLVPHSNNAPLFGDVARVAVEHKMWTDAVYLARLSVAAGAASSARVEQGIATGKWPTDTLFVLDEATARRIAASNDPGQNFLARVDGVAVLAPAWTGCSDCGAEALRFN